MSKPRRRPNASEKLAATLLLLKNAETGAYLIPEPLRSTGSAKEICAYVEFDHARHYACDGDTRPQNLTPLTKRDHREKTCKIDLPVIAKVKRGHQDHVAFAHRMLTKTGQGTGEPRELLSKPKKKIASRPFPKARSKNQNKKPRETS